MKMVIVIYYIAFFFLSLFLLQCVGTDRNIPDSVLQNRANTLYNILVTFHFNITEILDHKILSEQLNTVISSYLSLLLTSSNIFGTTAVFKFPKVMSVMVIWFLYHNLFYIFSERRKYSFGSNANTWKYARKKQGFRWNVITSK